MKSMTCAAPLGSYRFGDSRACYQRWLLLVSSSASCARGIAAGLPLAAEMSDADTRCRLAARATTLAELAEAIDARTTPRASSSARPSSRQNSSTSSRRSRWEPTSLRAVVHQLGRLAGTLGDLAQVVSGRIAERG